MTVNVSLPASQIRMALLDLPSEASQASLRAAPLQQTYVPLQHERALDPDTAIVVGDRGVGKSFWSAALFTESVRLALATKFPRLRLDRVSITVGHAVEDPTALGMFPRARVIASLRKEHRASAEDIWRTVILWHVTGQTAGPLPASSWPDRVAWVRKDPEREEGLLAEADERLYKEGRRHLIIFDALDRLGGWDDIGVLVRGLLGVCLTLRGYRAIRSKLFLRPDMHSNQAPEIWAVQDASKLTHNEVRLRWNTTDLYGLLWTYLGNHHEIGNQFRDLCGHGSFEIFGDATPPAYQPTQRLRNDEAIQEKILISIAGRYMGKNPRRGKTYTWLPNHLADASGYASPRSFLGALQHAADKSQGDQTALMIEAIKSGVQKASEVRVRELQEDYRWIDYVLRPLQDLTVPCEKEAVIDRWRKENVVDRIRRAADAESAEGSFLLPKFIDDPKFKDDRETGLLKDLESLHVISRLPDGRLNMPDIFRVAARMKRKGGVKPAR